MFEKDLLHRQPVRKPHDTPLRLHLTLSETQRRFRREGDVCLVPVMSTQSVVKEPVAPVTLPPRAPWEASQ